MEEMGCPGNRLPPCMGESSGEETLLTWSVFLGVLLPFFTPTEKQALKKDVLFFKTAKMKRLDACHHPLF